LGAWAEERYRVTGDELDSPLGDQDDDDDEELR
jgi:endogenous inhibitor of DNA gyrase (YacG/DUF329 family)